MSVIRAILFDCDGVLIDSEPMGARALRMAILETGLAMEPAAISERFSGLSPADTLTRMTELGLDADRMLARSDRILFDMFERDVPLVPGIENLLDSLDLPIAVCSNSSRERLGQSLARTSLAARFGGHIHSADDVAQPKPAPDMALRACRALGVDPRDAIFIDDNPVGLRCGIAAGCTAVGFIGPGDHRPGIEAAMRAAGAHHVVHGMDEFRALLTRISLPLTV